MGQNQEGIQHPQISKPQQNSNVNNIDVANNVEKKPKVTKNNQEPDYTDDINLTNSMIISESTDPNKSYTKLNCLGESEGSEVYRVKHNLTEDIRAMKIIKKSTQERKGKK